METSKLSPKPCKKQTSNQPKQYQQGWVEFYKLRFKVTSDVLIPRPETELLVDEILSFLASKGQALQGVSLIDIGTGAGNIAVSIAKHLPTSDVGTRIIASDISAKALIVARQNAELQEVSHRINFFQSNLLDNINNQQLTTDNLLIVTNLPYIPSSRIPYLDPSVKDWEPKVALDGGKDGFDLYRKLFKEINEKGWKPKLIIGEIDYTQGEIAIQEALDFFPGYQAEVKTDLAHKQRILLIRKLL